MNATLYLKTRFDDPAPPQLRDYNLYQANDNEEQN